MLDELRREIDEVDRELVRLFEKRMEISQEIGRYKRENGLAVTDAARERDLLEKRAGQLKNPGLSGSLRQFFTLLMETGKQLQRSTPAAVTPDTLPCGDVRQTRGPVAYQGIAGAYGEQAARLFFGEERALLSCPRFDSVFQAVESGHACAGVIPVENLLTGGITEVFDLLESHRCVILGEQTVHIEHCLMGLPGTRLSDIRQVVSHPQGLMQCSGYLDGHPDWERVPRLNTAEAAHYVSQKNDSGIAAIASQYAAQSYGLTVLARNIADGGDNRTRFVVLEPEGTQGQGTKHTLALVLPHTAGSLHAALKILFEGGFSLTFIQSRPFPGRSWEYRFFIDCMAESSGSDMQKTLARLSESGAQVRLLGTYEPVRG